MITSIESLKGTLNGSLALTGVLSVGTKINTQEKTVYPSLEDQNITPDEDYYLSKVIVKAVPFELTPNEYGGLTLTIG